MINRADAFWAWVWDTDKMPNFPAKRLVIDSNGGEWVVVISEGDVDDFLNMSCYNTEYYYHHQRIPEPKKRLMTREEILGFIAWNPHIVVRYYGEDINTSSALTYRDENLEAYEWAPITEAGEIGEWSKFEVEDDLD